MKIAFAHSYVFRFARGIERYTISLAGSLSRQSVDTSIVTLKEKNSVKYSDLSEAVKIITLFKPKYYASVLSIPFYLLNFLFNRYNMIFIYFAGNAEGTAVKIVSRLLKTNYGIVFHFPYEAAPVRYEEFEKSGLLKNALVIVSVSHYIQQSVKKRFNRDSYVIHNGVDEKQFHRDKKVALTLKKELKIKHSERIILSVGALEERKGFQYIIHALPKVLKKEKDIKLIIVGDGNFKGKLINLAKEFGVLSSILFIDYSEHMNTVYNLADVFMLLSQKEAFGMVVLEAMAVELPVVVSKDSAFPEFVDESVGKLVNEKDSEDVANAILEFISNKEKRLKIGKNARKRVIEKFSWDKVAEKYIGLYKETLKG